MPKKIKKATLLLRDLDAVTIQSLEDIKERHHYNTRTKAAKRAICRYMELMTKIRSLNRVMHLQSIIINDLELALEQHAQATLDVKEEIDESIETVGSYKKDLESLNKGE